MYKTITNLKAEDICILVLCIACIFSKSPQFNNQFITPKWLFSILLTCLLLSILCVKIAFTKAIKINLNNIKTFICILCTVEAIYGISIYISSFILYNEFPKNAIGSFDNPAGFAACLCMGIPIIIYNIFYTKNKQRRKLYYFEYSIIFIALLLSHSRTGILTSIVPIIIVLIDRLRGLKIKAIIVIVVMLILPTLYFFNTESITGRILIWNCSLDMINDAPILGHGVDSFRRLYMQYQANYFVNNPNSEFAQLADSVQLPYNEIIRIISNFGILGFVIILITLYFLISTKSKLNIELILAISVFITLSLTSFPFSYPFTWLMLIYWILYTRLNSYKVYYLHQRVILIPIISLCIFLGIHTTNQILFERYWHEAEKNHDIEQYDKIHSKMKHNPYFLYHYARALMKNGDYRKAKKIAIECRMIFSDYDLDLLLGDIELQLGNYCTAKSYYKSCCNMCPNRFIPLYQLFILHKKCKNDIEAKYIAQLISQKKEKVPSNTTRMIKNQANQFLTTKN